nr:hypothetical protein [uncultured Albidiferax sp.]
MDISLNLSNNMIRPSAIQELRQAQTERAFFWGPHPSFFHSNYSEANHLYSVLDEAIVWVDKVSRSANTLFKFKSNEESHPVNYSILGRQFVGILAACLYLIHNRVPGLHFDPRIELVLDVISSRRLNYWTGFNAELSIQDNPPFWIDTLNACVQEIRSTTNRRSFSSALEKHRGSIDRRFKTLKAYFHQLDKTFPHSIVLRFDLLLKNTTFILHSRPDERYDALRAYGTDWLQQVKTALGPALVGNAWKHDLAPDGSLMMHAALVLNGPQGDEMPDIISMLTSTWVKASAGAGYWINCHAPPYLFEYRGLHDEATQHLSVRAELHNCAVYLAKTDGTMRLEFKEKPPTYGMGTEQHRLCTRMKQVQRGPQATQSKPIHDTKGKPDGQGWGSLL